MKKLMVLGLIFFSFLFQSCSSYKSIDYDSAMADKYQKIRVVMIDGTKYNGTLVKKDEQNLYISTRDGTTLKIPQKGIYEVQVQKLSFLKTSLFISLPIIGISTFILIVNYILPFF
ncbi:MAG: hypothetical protein CMC80_01050 [Flavobacteriaceae bacterium]|nr:hypothetical protein [Flavobacteriaceae bacterium]|tara:strand:+ start:12442 stop:12789 length:348 start_codon:yes stop_codon:yes gene_type:complete